MTTVGDRVLNISLPKIGEKSLFTKDLEDALKTGGVDLVVHSLKDLPTSLPDGMAIGAILEREDPRDALVLNEKFRGKTLDTLPAGSVIGTSSLRRSAQLSRTYPHLKVCDVRGNLNTRLSKLDAADSPMSGLLLAKAGLVRMGWEHRVDQTLDCSTSLYAIGQGALAVECRANDPFITELIAPLTHRETLLRVLAERSFLKTLGGGCSAPVAISSKLQIISNELDDLKLTIRGAVWSLDGKTLLEDTLNANISNPSQESESEIHVVSQEKIECKSTRDGDEKQNKTADAKTVANGSKPFVDQDSGDKAADNCPARTNQVRKISVSNDCPLDLPIGQDFMGECPFLKAGHMKNIEKCPYKINEHSNELCCPLRRNSKDCNDEMLMNVLACSSKGALKLDKCPFLSQKGENTQKEEVIAAMNAACGRNRKTSHDEIDGDSSGPKAKRARACEAVEETKHFKSAENDLSTNGSKTSDKVGKDTCGKTCPIDLPVGNEFMGQCPYKNNETTYPKNISCPLRRNSKDCKETTPLNTSHTAGEELDKCHSATEIKTVEYNESSSNSSNVSDTQSTLDIYCGILEHKSINKCVMEQCEGLGRQLADVLIANGALDVMKCAQMQIRSTS